MAEFKLGRIRFVWKGAWVASTEYFRDDIIRYGGRTYICVSGHTSATLFITDEATKWQKFSDGSEWQSDWTSGATYKVNDIVKYGGYLYICNTGHISETPGGKLETDQAKWDLFSEGFAWKDIWTTSTHYKINDIVKYGGTLYLCTDPHTSSATFASDIDGLEADAAKWDTFAQGQDWKTDWVEATRYKKHDEVKYGGILYICNQGHISGTTAQGIEADQTKWDYLHKGVEYLSVHASTTRYKLNDVVKYGGGLWICNNFHTSTTTLAADVTISGNIATIGTISGADATRTAGTYNDVAGTSSGPGDVANTRFNIVIDGSGAASSVTIVHGGSGHVATNVISIPNTEIGGSGATLTFNVATIQGVTQWSEFVAGLEFEDSWSSATNYQPGDFVTYGGYSYISKSNNSNIVPFGNAGDWDLFTTGFNLQGDYNNGTAYKVGDVIRLGGYTYLAKANTTGNRPPNATYWERLNQGIEWKDAWADATLYDAGDAVRGIGNINSYICILAHTSDEVSAQNRPDQDTLGTYWQLLSGGVESGNLTTVGDLVYYGGAGPVRLPIGTPGQVLKVNAAGDAPEWAYFGQVEGVYYVAPSGVDGVAPVDGVTLDKPWKSVRYALNEIRKGPRNPDAAILLKRNKAFIAEEAGVQYVAWKIANNSAPFSTGYTHDAAKCKRDMGQIIDGFLYDIGHGDNRRSRENALSFFSTAGASYIAGQTSQTVDVINYMVSIIDTTIRNLTPTINYQTLNGIAGGSQVIQKIDATKTAEDGVYTSIQSLAAIITDAITAGVITNIPVEVFAYNTLFVKTGIYKETLPMIIPEGTAVIGDELRSTEINALGSADSVTTLAHTTLTLNGLLHIKSIIDDIITNNAITKTAASPHLTMDAYSAADASRTLGTYTGVTGTSSGTGTVGTFDIVVGAGGAITSVTVITGGHGHVINNTITITDANLGGGGGANFTMDVATVGTGNVKTQDVALPAGSAGAGTRAQQLFQDIHDKINIEVFGVGTEPKLTGKTGRDATQGYVDARLRILENLDFIADEVVAYLQTTYTSVYDFTKDAKCRSDMKAYLDAVLHDMENYGNYKSFLYGRWSSNAVKGSKHEDMYYCHNATGIRNQTLKGLKGTFYKASVTTTVAHGKENGELIEIRDLSVGCSLGTKTYPLAPTVFTPSAATFDPATGVMELTIGTHALTTDHFIKIAPLGLTFTCAHDSHATNHSYPRSGGADTVYNKSVAITAVSATTITVNVGTSSNTTAHTFVSATTNSITHDVSGFTVLGSGLTGTAFEIDIGTSGIAQTYVSGGTVVKSDGTRLAITGFSYVIGTGIATITTATHSLSASNVVNVYGIVTSCAYGTKVYPQMANSGTYPVTRKVSDTELNFFLPDSDVDDHAWLSGGTVKTATITNVGSATNITAFNYANTSGYTTVTSTAHGLAIGDYVRIQSVKVSCTQGSKVYPDPHTSSAVFIVYDVIDANTFAFGMDKSTFVHTYDSGGTVQKVTYTATDSKTVAGFRYSPKGLENDYGTKRPNSGAFVSLDPSWGPNDKEAFIHLKSPYIQNVTNIGEKCVGLKIDGDLHSGGLDSFVANDFTQIDDEGISIWCTNLGRVELVSVFTYYGHIGYLAENGGKIRATNGNNSYGDFGSVSEGIDLTEEAIVAYVDNRSYQAIIGNVIVDNNKIIAVEYTNAGRDYVTGNTTYLFSGDGYGITGTTAATVTGGVMQVRLTGSSSTFGGADYITAGNTIQAGTDTQITLSNTDTAISSAYIGMAIVLTSGKGAGQIAYIDTYNAATKVATVKKPSDDTAGWNHMTGATIETLLDNTTTYSVEPRVTFSAPGGDGSTATSSAKGRTKVVDGKIVEVRLYDPGASYVSTPTVTFTDPNNTADATYEVYIGDNVLTQPTFTDAGTGWTTVSATVLDSGQTKNITGVTYTANPFAVILLEANKEYIKDEVTAWIDSQIAGGSNPSLWDDFVHDKVKCERDIGYLVDAFVHDIKYGSNRDTVTAARRYWIGTNFVGGEAPQIVAAYEQMRTIILDYILDNTAYTSLQSETTQTTNGNNGEAVAQTRCGELITIITQVVTHGLSVIPASGSDGIVDITVTGHSILGKSKIAISDIVGTNQLNNNSFYVGVVDVDTLRLYIDENLLYPVVGDTFSAYISDGTITYGGGYREQKQDGKYLQVESMIAIPQSGANVEFDSVPNTWFKLVSVTNLTGSKPYSALLQLSPNVEIPQSPLHGEKITIRIRYSQVRLTGHDFLDVGTGNFISTNYPGIPQRPSDQLDETVDSGGGRVFMTSTDQDGNFRVGDLFTVEQATGIATLNADAFSISGLQELQLGSVELGTAGATINEFSTDGTFTANSDQIVPTQRAIKTFITSQIGGGASELNVNSVTAGIINIQGNTITTTTGARINTTATMHFSAGVSGAPVAMQQFLLS